MPDVYCVDFDGVLAYHESGWPITKIGHPLIPGVQLLQKLKKQGYEIVILTARPVHTHFAIFRWFQEHGLDRYISRITNVKPPAVAYLDDKAVPWQKNLE